MADPVLIDHITSALGHLLEQWKGKPRFEALITAALGEINFAEVALHQVLTITSIDDSEGAQLDTIGKIFRQPRGQKDDTTYRLFLKGKIQALLSGGDVAGLYSVLEALYPSGIFPIEPAYPANLRVLFLDQATSLAEGIDVVQLLAQAKAGGIGLRFFFTPVDPSETVEFDDFWDPVPDVSVAMGDYWDSGTGGGLGSVYLI